MSTVGGYLEYRGGCSVPWGNHDKCGGSKYAVLSGTPCIMCVQYRGRCSVPWGVFSTVREYHEYRGGIS